jgi:uncharacterized repeat protein (TIGR02543 family)
MSKKKTVKKIEKSKSELRDEAKARQIAVKKAKITAEKQKKERLRASKRAKKKKLRAQVKEARLKKKYPYAIPPRNKALTSAIIAVAVAGLLFLSYFFLNPVAAVSFDSTGGSDVRRELIWKGSVIDEPDSPVREGYTFKGWYNEPSFENKFDFASKIRDNTTLYAKWIPIDFAINIILNGGNYTAADDKKIETFTIEEETSLPTKDEMSKDGYIFEGWFTDGYFIPGTEITFIPKGTAKAVTIFAKWVKAIEE